MEATSQNIMLVDASPLIYSCFNAVGHLATTTGIPTGLRYQFLRSIRSHSEKVKADRVVICYDTKAPVKKAEGVSEYKSDRVFTEDKKSMYDQVPDLKAMLSLTWWTQAEAPGYEADDIVGWMARQLSSKGHKIFIHSTDNDFMQLVSNDIKIINKNSKKKSDYLKTDQTVLAEFGVWPEHLLFYRAVAGDVSDHVAGVGLDPEHREHLKTWLKTLPRERMEVDEYINRSKDVYGLSQISSTYPEAIRRNFNLMFLHKPEGLNLAKGTRDAKALLELFELLEFKSMIPHIANLTGN